MSKASRAATTSGDNGGTASSQPPVFLTEDIMINIFLRLPTASCIARFRCVCRSWRVLLSDPQFIHRYLFFQNPDDLKSLQILFAGGLDYTLYDRITPVDYTLHSYDTLGLISAGQLPSAARRRRFGVTVVGCCNGIFCIADENFGVPSDLLLWNPATSETKLIGPRTTCPPYLHGIGMSEELTGFGYDPETDDYKVVRILRLELCCYRETDPGFADLEAAVRDFPHPIPFTYAEVYSLRNDSWKQLDVSEDLANNARDLDYVNQEREVSRNQRCYWLFPWDEESRSLSFDMSQEVFEYTWFNHPPALCGCDRTCLGFSMLKEESFVMTFMHPHRNDIPYQVWGLLKLGVNDSWTKLLTIAPLGWPHVRTLEDWKEGAYICMKETDRGPKQVYISFPEALGEEVGRDRIEILGLARPLQALCYTPTQTSLSLLE